MKNLKKNAFSLLAGLFLLFSCDDFTEDTAGENSVLPNDGRAYICVREAGSSKSVRTALPSFSEDGIADFTFTIKGKKTSDSGPEEVLGSFDTLSDLKGATIALESGTWNFTLTAEKDGTVLSGKLENKEISAASNPNQLSFELSWDKSTLEGEGSLSFSLDFSKASNSTSVQCATGQLLKYDSESGSETELPDYPETELSILDADDKPLFKAVYELSAIDAGNYRIKIRLYADSEKKNLIITWPELAIITGGQKSSASRECNSLNEVYSITYNNPLEAVTVDGSSLQEAYTRYSGDIVLHDLEKEGYTFEGWFDNEDCSGEALEVIAGGSTGDKILWAKLLIPDIYVSASATEDGVGSEAHPFKDLNSALELISDSNTDYTIHIDGEITGSQKIASNNSSSDIKAKTITLCGIDENAKLVGNETSSVLTISTAVPVIIKNLTITGGHGSSDNQGTKGGGLLVEGYSEWADTSATVTIEDGVKITGNKAEYGAGVYLAAGTLYMNGGEISENTATGDSGSWGGGVYVGSDAVSAKFIMSGGLIAGNKALSTASFYNAAGGGVYINSESAMYMSGNAVIGNKDAEETATSSESSNTANVGGGIYVSGSNANLYLGYSYEDDALVEKELGGGIYYNWASSTESYSTDPHGSAGGVYLASGSNSAHGSLYMKSGNITYNAAERYGGGLYSNEGTFEMGGGIVSANTAQTYGSGLYANDGTFSMSGSAIISVENDVYLSDCIITITGELTGTSPVATITPDTYTAETTILEVSSDAGTTLAAEYEKFAIIPLDDDNTLTVWNLTSEGILNKLDSISSEDELRLAASLLTNGKTVELDVTGNIQISKNFAVPEGAILKLNRASDYKDVLIAPYDDIVIGSETSGKLILDGGYDGTDSGISSEGPLAGGFTGAVYYNVIFQNNFNKGSTEAGLPYGYSGRGGAVSAWNSTSGSAKNLRMYNCTINNCKALYGGALFISGGAQDSGKLADGLVNVTISNCVATVQGGAIYRDEMLSESTIKLNGCTITGCTAGNGSGSGNIFYIKAFSNNFVEHTCHLYVDGSLLKDVGRDSSPYVADKLTYGNKTSPDSVGDIVFSDGSAVAYSEDLTLTSAQQAAAVAVIYYIGSSSPDTSTIEGRLFSQLGVKKLGVGLKNSSSIETTDEKRFQWATEESYLYSNSVSVSGISYAFDTSSGITGAWSNNTEYIVFTSGSDFDGSDNFAAIKTALGTNDDTGVTGRYPAWDWINSYTTYADNLSETAYSSGWYMPTMPEICPLMNNIEVINSALLKAGGTAIDDAWFVTSNYDGSISAAWQGTILSNKYAKEDYDVLAVRVFE